MVITATLAILLSTHPCQVKGRIQIVPSSADADLRVKVVTPATDALPDLRVQIVDWIADRPGYWRIVDHSPDYKIMLVDFGEDFTIQYVNYQPGCRSGC